MNPLPVINAVVFDLDGTLVDSRTAVVEAVARGVERVLARHGVERPRADRDRIVQAMGLPPHRYYREILPPAAASWAREVQDEATAEEVRALAAGEGRLVPKALETLSELRARKVRIAIVSNAQEPYFRAALEYLGLQALSDHRECHEQLPAHLPKGKDILLQRALRAVDTAPENALMVGDRREDIAAGRQVGTLTAAASWGFAAPGELEEADWLLTTMAQLLDRIPGRPPRESPWSPGGL